VAGNIDERIVEMTFKGESFVAQIRASVEALLSLKSGLNGLKGSENDINNLDSAGKRFSLSGMSNGIAQATHNFSLLRIAGLTAFTSLVRQGLFAGEQLLKSFTIDPIKAGLDVYEQKINAIKTVLANTAQAGTTLKQVTDALNQLNTYANLTVYNFGEMAQNVGTFTAAGVGLKTAVASIKGIANLAALSGSSAQQASSAMYQLSQAIAAGRVKLQDWNSVVNAGLGGKVFQQALETTAKATGVNIDAIIKKAGSFRQSLQQGWLSSKILTQTLDTFTGDLSLKQLKAMGYTNAEAEAIQKQGLIAVQSATQIKTISSLMQALKEEVATGWSKVWEALVGNIGQATVTLSALHQTLENFFTKPIYDLAAYLQQWNDLGGRTKLIDAFTNGFKFLASVMHVVGSAFREVFPPSAANGLLNITTALDNFTKHLKLSSQDATDIKTIFVGIFSIFKILIDVVDAVAGGIGKVGTAAKSSSGGLLHFVANIASLITDLRKAIESGNGLTKFFQFLGTVISIPIRFLGSIISALGGVSGAFTKLEQIAAPVLNTIGNLLHNLGATIVQGITSGNFSAISTLLNHLLVGSILLTIRKFVKGLGADSGGGDGGLFAGIKESFEALTDALKTMQANLKAAILQKIAIAVGILAASLLVLSLINVKQLTAGLTAITTVFTELIGAMAILVKLSTPASIVKMAAAGVTLNLLATAILILSAAVEILSHLSWQQLAKGLAAVAILLIELVTATKSMSVNSKGTLAAAYSMETMAVAMNIMAKAVKALGEIPFGNLAKGVGAVAALLAILGTFNALGGEKSIASATALVIIGAALLIITKAVGTLGALPLGTLGKGILGIAGSLVVIAIALNAMPPDMLVTAASLVIVSAALLVLSKALTAMGGMSWVGIAKSLIVLAGSLIIIAAAMILMTEALPGAAALIIVATALAILAPVLTTMSKIPWEGIAKDMVLLIGALAAIAAAMILMTEALPGAAALLVVATALGILAPVLVVLSTIPWEGIAKDLITLVGVFLILAAAGIVLTPLVPTLIGIGAAIALFGIGVLAAGVGIGLFALGLTALAGALAASGAAIFSFVSSMLGLIPVALTDIANGIVAFAAGIARGGAAIEAAFTTLLVALLDAITKIAPKAALAFDAVMNAVLSSVNKYAPKVITTFLNLLLTLLNKAASYAPRFATAAGNLIVNMINAITRQVVRFEAAATTLIIAFINGIGDNLARVAAAGVSMVIRLVNSIANEIRASSGAFSAASRNLGSAIIEGIIEGIEGGIGGVISAAVGMAKSALSSAMHALHINSPSKDFRDMVGAAIPEGTALGIHENTHLATDEVVSMSTAMLSTVGKTMAGLNDAINSNLELQPVITPVIDLTQAKSGLGELAGLTKNQLISASTSTNSAASISAANAVIAAAAAAKLSSVAGSSINFTQTNYSPKALSEADIYRRTKNQLSIARGALSANSSSNN
jgi:tape measure domain-containing protein